MAEIFTVETRGVGKPDYSRIVAGAKERRGIHLDYGQTLKIFALTFAPSPAGAHTGGPNFTIMTDALATFVANELIGLIIVNVTDGSSGVIIANTVNTVTVVALVGGITNRWNLGDIYSVGGAFPQVVPSLAPGAMIHAIDNETGLSLPFIVPQGYNLTLISAASALSEDVSNRNYIDTFFLGGAFISGGQPYYENKIFGVSTATYDPTGAITHLIDITITNEGGGNLLGSTDAVFILEEVGSPALPLVKTVKCKWCGYEHQVPNETTNIICPKCGKLFIVYDLSKFRRTP